MYKIILRFVCCFLWMVSVWTQLAAQSENAPVTLDAGIQRQVITASAQDQTVYLQNLKKGETYSFIVPPDVALGNCLPVVSLVEPTATLLQFDAARHMVVLKALSAQAQLRLEYPCNWEASNPPRHYVSIQCKSCQTKPAADTHAEMSVLEVEGADVEELIREIFIGGDCFDVSNISFSGQGNNIGKFTSGQTNVGFQNGLIMATGDISVAPGPNNVNGAGNGGNPGFDADLFNISTGQLFDVTTIEFDFTPTQTPLSFRYAFASEEYCEYVNTMFNDVFGFFISGPGISGTKNLAVVPATTTPVTINTINHVLNSALYRHNTPAGLDNCENGGVSGTLPPVPPASGPATIELQYDGLTKEMVAVAEVIPCSTYHIKLAISDVADGVWDSAVFLKANSFDAGGDVLATAEYQNNQESATEGCEQGFIHFVRGNSDLSQPVVVNFTVAGTSTAMPGVDFEPLVSPVVIPIGQSEIVVPVNVYFDNLTEGQEHFTLLIDNNCKCQQGHVDYLIDDSDPFATVVSQDTSICEGYSVSLYTTTTGGLPLYTYAWSSGETTSSIVVAPTVTTQYTVTVTDACGSTATDAVTVDVIPIFRNTIDVTLCPGGSVEIAGVVYTGPGIVMDTSYEVFYCGQITTYVITLADPAQGSETINFCQGGSVEIGGVLYSESGTVVDTLSTTAGCDSIVTYTLVMLPPVYGTDTVAICRGSSVEIGGQVYTDAGTAIDTLSTSAGCDSIVTYTLVVLPLTYGDATVTFCPGDTVTIGGNTYHESGTVVDTLTGITGCDSIVTYTLVVLPLTYGQDTISFCPGDTVFVGGQAYFESGTVLQTLTGATGCDSIVTHTLVKLPQPTRLVLITFCPGESVIVGGNTYTESGMVVLTVPGIFACDTIVTYKLELLPQPTRAETIRFCPGESVTLGGNTYTQPGTVVLEVPASVGCDTIVTYTLQYLIPAPSVVAITCPNTVTVGVPSGVNESVVNYDDPTATSNCPCPGIDLTRTSGLASGSTFPLGASQVCFTAQDKCGQTKTCCFTVKVEEDDPCDTKVIGCMKYELLTITQDQYKNKTYRIRVTNNCPTELLYTAIQTPSGFVATSPADNSIYTAPSGNDYLVRNPNYTPFYSVRFKSMSTGISNGESDILRYTLPAQADVLFIRIISKVSIQQYYEAHLNTFYCPVGVTPVGERSDERPYSPLETDASVLVFPNPTDGIIQVDLADWEGAAVQMQVFNSQGQRVLFHKSTATLEPERLNLPQGIGDGLYFLEISTEAGEKEVVKFVVRH